MGDAALLGGYESGHIFVGVLAGDDNDNLDYTLNNVTIDANVAAAASGMITEDTIAAAGNATGTAENATIKVSGDGVDEEEIAIEKSLETIDTPEELALLATRANEKGTSYKAGTTIKVTADLDMNGIDFQPINRLAFNLDFDGHTVSNLVVNTNGYEGFAGLLVCRTENHVAIYNVSLYNCELNTNNVTNVGVVMGLGDRSVVTSAKLEKITVNATGATKVGGVFGERWWGSNQSADMVVEMTDVVFNVDGATSVGLVAGLVDGADNTLVNITSLKAENVTINNNAEGFDASAVTYAGTNNAGDKMTVAEDKVEINLTETAVSYVDPNAPVEPDEPDVPVDPATIPGDVNGDGTVNMADPVMLHQSLNSWDVEIDEIAADVNADGKVDMRDAVLIQQYLNYWDVELKLDTAQ